MPTQQIAICEQGSLLTAHLEREYLRNSEVTFRWLPYPDDFFFFLSRHECVLAIFEADKLTQDHLQQLSEVARTTSLMAVAPADDFEFECLLRELGVQSIIEQGTDLQRVVKSVQRFVSGAAIASGQDTK